MPHPPPSPRTRGPFRIFVLGDSISIEYGPLLERALGPAFDYARKSGEEAALRDLDIPRGANGGDSAMVREFLGALAAGAFHVDLLLVNCGLHDIKRDPATGTRQVAPDRYRQNLRAIVDLGRRLADAMVWVETTPVDDALHALRGCGFERVQADVVLYGVIAAEVMAAAQVPTIELGRFTATLGAGPAIFRDGVHFLPAVQSQQAAFIGGWLNRAAGTPTGPGAQPVT